VERGSGPEVVEAVEAVVEAEAVQAEAVEAEVVEAEVVEEAEGAAAPRLC
jgi:hypothetical protein